MGLWRSKATKKITPEEALKIAKGVIHERGGGELLDAIKNAHSVCVNGQTYKITPTINAFIGIEESGVTYSQLVEEISNPEVNLKMATRIANGVLLTHNPNLNEGDVLKWNVHIILYIRWVVLWGLLEAEKKKKMWEQTPSPSNPPQRPSD